MTTINIQRDLRGLFGKTRDQGSRPTCAAFAMSDLHSSCRSPKDSFSAEYLYFHANRREATPDPYAGVGIGSIRAAVVKDGQPAEEGWPYQDSLPADLSRWRPPSNVGTIFSHETEVIPARFDEVWSLVLAEQPILMAMSISKSFFTPEQSGLVSAIEPVDPVRLHAVIGVGVGYIGRARCLLIRNSWGSSWGLGGHAWLSESYIRPRMVHLVALN